MNDIGPLIQQEDVGPFQQPVQDFPSFLRSEVEADPPFVYVSQQEQAAAFLVGNTARVWTVPPAIVAGDRSFQLDDSGPKLGQYFAAEGGGDEVTPFHRPHARQRAFNHLYSSPH